MLRTALSTLKQPKSEALKALNRRPRRRTSTAKPHVVVGASEELSG